MDDRRPNTIDICFLLTPRFDLFALSAVMEVAQHANRVATDTLYTTHMLSLDGPLATAHQPAQIKCEAPASTLSRTARVFVPGGPTSQNYANPETLAWLRAQARRGVALTGITTGAHILARAGLLAGKKATMHWPQLPAFAEQFPQVSLSDRLACTDGQITTCAGGTAIIDMMLHSLSADAGQATAARVASLLNHYPIRPIDTEQKALHTATAFQMRPKVRAAAALIEDTVGAPLSVPDIARHVGLSQRQLERQFAQDLGCTIVQFGLRTRLDHAQRLIQTTSLSIREISIASGFSALPHFSTAFSKRYGVSPASYRTTFHNKEPDH